MDKLQLGYWAVSVVRGVNIGLFFIVLIFVLPGWLSCGMAFLELCWGWAITSILRKVVIDFDPPWQLMLSLLFAMWAGYHLSERFNSGVQYLLNRLKGASS